MTAPPYASALAFSVLVQLIESSPGKSRLFFENVLVEFVSAPDAAGVAAKLVAMTHLFEPESLQSIVVPVAEAIIQLKESQESAARFRV